MNRPIEYWACPRCFTSPYVSPSKFVNGDGLDTDTCNSLRVILKDELTNVCDELKATVVNTLSESVCSKDDLDKSIKTYAQVAEITQKKVLEEAVSLQSTKLVATKVAQKLDTDRISREDRKSNVIVMKVPESNGVTNGQRNGDDFKFCVNELGIDKRDIDTCFRVGIWENDNKDQCRPLVIRMCDAEAANYWTNDGKGFKTESGYYINPDLCKADREARFLVRQERRKRLEEQRQQQNRSSKPASN